MKSSPISPIIVGFGSQAKAWAKNLKDSKIKASIALTKSSPSRLLAQELGFEVIDLESDTLKKFKLFILLIPDDQHLAFFEKNHSFFCTRTHFVYAHGFSLSKEKLADKYPQFVHSLLAPKAIASEVRFQYETKGKIGAAFFSPDKDAESELRELAQAVGFNALFPSHFDEETLADLFSEQSLLCSILPYVSLKTFNLLRKNGVGKEVAFMECFLELQSISSAFVKMGPEAFFKLISPNALIGSQKGREVLLGKEFDIGLEKLLADNKSKKFYKEVEIDAHILREKVLNEWQQEELTQVFKELKKDLIN